MDKILEKLANGMESWVIGLLDGFSAAVNQAMNVLGTEVAKTPSDFSASLVYKLRQVSDASLLPIAGLILTYIFAYKLIQLVTEKNNQADFDTLNMFKVIFEMFIAILLVTNAFNITLAFFDVGKYIVTSAGDIAEADTTDIATLVKNIIDTQTGSAKFWSCVQYLLISFVVMIAGWAAVICIYIACWSRIVQILIYISVAPIPFACFMNRDWIGNIGQNYIKNLLALALQGYFMLIVVMVYKSIVVVSIRQGGDNPISVMAMVLVSMYIAVTTLFKCQSIAKSVMQAS